MIINLKTLINILIAALLLISARVAVGLLQHQDMWRFICSYWIILTAKNLLDFVSTKIKNRKPIEMEKPDNQICITDEKGELLMYRNNCAFLDN